ncbi:uncharacterized protein J4E79_010971 [Alternaria viburni]|uniref:uncharacterized protein n=1 Tax=Alternaria viburni TaxID=566460 RepID=UPI0020C2979E|nr:uncharacterized protein J4E79_010971 [Alternaria viburni]KAI4644836.1 hypothetical protein J4E79_010971 [Alternaria viburni]
MAPRKCKAPSSANAAFAQEIRDERARRRDVIRDPSSLDRLTELNSIESPLLRLPAEIKIMIFTYIFSGNEYIFRGRQGNLVSCAGSFTQMDMGLLLVSRQAYADTALLPYKLGRIYFLFAGSYHWSQCSQSIENFLKKRSAEQIKAIVSLRASGAGEKTGVWWANKLAQRTKLSQKRSTMPSRLNGQPPAKKRRFEGAEERAAIRRLREQAPRDKM